MCPRDCALELHYVVYRKTKYDLVHKTSFDYRPYGTELALCQRYLYKVDGTDGLSSVGAGSSIILTGTAGALDLLTFIVSYDGTAPSNSAFRVVGFAATDFRNAIV